MNCKPGSIRIIGGRWRGTRLPVADVAGLRPSSDRARETLFNWLASILPGARVLDLFAGSGALGLEALSRGACEAVLVEREATVADSLRSSIARLHADAEARLVVADALAWLRTPPPGRFDIVFIDPPFAAGLWPQVFAALPPWLVEQAWIYVESPANAAVNVTPPADFALHREGRTREARHALYRRVTLAAHPPEPDQPFA